MARCDAGDCDRPAVCRGLCVRHYKRMQRAGTVALRCPSRGLRYGDPETRYRTLVVALEDCDTGPAGDEEFERLKDRLRKAKVTLARWWLRKVS